MHNFEGPDVDRWAVPPAGEQGDGWKLDSDEGQAAALGFLRIIFRPLNYWNFSDVM